MYVGQTITNFSTRWSQHRSIWKSGSSEHNDKAALCVHFQKEHADKKTVHWFRPKTSLLRTSTGRVLPLLAEAHNTFYFMQYFLLRKD